MSSFTTERLLSGLAPSNVTALGEHGEFSIIPDAHDAPKLREDSPILHDINTTFSVEGFAVPRTPLKIGETALESLQELPEEIAIADMVIKWPGLGYRVPTEVAALRGLLQNCANVEASINPHIDDFFAYLTVQRSVVQAGKKSRSNEPHSDSVQGKRIQPKQIIEHGYTMTDTDPTRFFTHGFDLTGVDPDRYWLNAFFNDQANLGSSVQFNPGDVVLFDAYSVHDGVPSEQTCLRTFLRLIYSVRVFDRLGNTVNKLFDYDWDFQPRPVPSDLIGLPHSG